MRTTAIGIDPAERSATEFIAREYPISLAAAAHLTCGHQLPEGHLQESRQKKPVSSRSRH